MAAGILVAVATRMTNIAAVEGVVQKVTYNLEPLDESCEEDHPEWVGHFGCCPFVQEQAGMRQGDGVAIDHWY